MRKRMKPRVFFMIFLFLFFFLFSGFTVRDAAAQSAARAASSPLSLEVVPNPVGRGDRFSVTILVAVENTENISVEAPDLPDSIILLRGPYIRPVWVNNAAGQSEPRAEITYLYRGDATGRFEIGAFRIATANRVYTTEPRLLEVGIYRNRRLVIPLEIVWDIAVETAYVGQNVLCLLKSLDEKDIRLYEKPVVSPPSEGFFLPAEGVGEIRKYSRAGVPLYEIPLAAYIFTPSVPGRITIPGASVEWENGSAASDRVVLEVKPLPGQVQNSGAVGSFRLVSAIEKEEVALGERLRLDVRIEGTGNLNFLEFPSVEAKGFSVLEKDEASDYRATPAGYRGSREYSYTLLAEEAGEKTIRVGSYTAIRPEDGQVYTLPASSYEVRVKPPEKAGAVSTRDEDFPFHPPRPAEFGRINLSARFLDWTEYLWMLPGPLLFLIFLMGRHRKLLLPVVLGILLSFTAVPPDTESFNERVLKADGAYRSGEYMEAEYLYGELARDFPEIPDLYFAAGISAYRLGHTGEAVWNARTALMLQPLKTDYRDFLVSLSEREGISTTMDLPFLLHPDFFLFILTLTLNFASFVGIFLLFYRKNAYFIAAVLLLALSLAAGGGMLTSCASLSRETAIVLPKEGSEVQIKKIPRRDSSAAFTLKEGESIKIRGEAEEFFYILTSLGQKGWIVEEDVRMIPGPVEVLAEKSNQSNAQRGKQAL
jgi:hypothetical protein